VNGNLLVKGTGMKIPASAKPEIFVDNEKVDSLQLDATASTYTVKLPHGRMYNLQVRANRFDPIPYTLDLTDVHEYQEIRADLFADEEKMAIISGNVIDKKTGKPLVAKGKVTLKVEGIKSVVADVDSATSHFELKLLPGHTYTVSASVPNYYPIYEEIDLTAERDNVHIYKDLVIVPIEVGQSIRLNNIFFESGKAVLKKESFVELDRVVEFLDASPDIKIEIGGHTDNVGKAATNLKLSTARANSVTKYIVAKGISASRISPMGYGLTTPVTENKSPQGRSHNRRVEFTILDK
jgi:outer membrane protein OmpA-like peptidoglycan-associated protein